MSTFFGRTERSMIHVEGKTGVRDMVMHNADFVEKRFSKRLNMEYDWKRMPYAAGMSNEWNHLVFSTRPWGTVDHFDAVREAWETYTGDGLVCLKTMEAFDGFAKHVEIQSFMSIDLGKYIKKNGKGDIDRLRQMLCSAWRQSKAGLTWRADGMSANDFAELLEQHGIPCKKTDVENGKSKAFVPNNCPPTDAVKDRLASLKADFPDLDIEAF